ncbi:MAG: hypothetical protein OXR72_08745 [Gemmatimonadota bacterium]|nr:hypothetical protein [Gemmatimonadota bacterium]
MVPRVVVLVLLLTPSATSLHANPASVPPVYERLKDLHLNTSLVENGRAAATIVVPANGMYDVEAARIQRAILERTGVQVPLTQDDSPAVSVPIAENLILLGNRSTNRTISKLYDRYYTLLDLKYPGPGGYVVRSLHNPFGNGRNVIAIGGSDAAGVGLAADVFMRKVAENAGNGAGLSVGWMMEIRLGKAVQVPEALQEFETWEASAGYRSVGYFGWNSISKHMAMYYMTGQERHAREFLRLAFPDDAAKAQIAAIDGERIENKDEPLSGPYHYTAHMLVLYWDLIEESPVFTNEQRLRITNAFAKQFSHDPYGQSRTAMIVRNLDMGREAYNTPPAGVGSRHHQWAAIALYCLGRYFQKDYPHPLWQHCIWAAEWQFSSLRHHAWVMGEADNLYWYSTGIAPILTYMLISGNHAALENGVLKTLLRGQEMLISGREPDWALRYASIGYLHKAAYLTGDGRYLEYARRTGVSLDEFRLGQSFWPESGLAPVQPADLVRGWSVLELPEPLWKRRASGLPLSDSFQFGSFRSATDATGDFILIDGLNGASRNPYHSFAVLELRLDGETVLQGYGNQVLTGADGLVEPRSPMDAALRYRDVVGRTAVAVAEVPNASFCSWRRALAQREGRYALFVDRLTFRVESADLEVRTEWTAPGRWRTASADGESHLETGGNRFGIRASDPVEITLNGRTATLAWTGAVSSGEERAFFSLIAPAGTDKAPVSCLRIGTRAAVLGLPAPAIAVDGEYGGIQGDVVLLAGDHLFGKDLKTAGLEGVLFSAERPVDLDWDFHSGSAVLTTAGETQIRAAFAEPAGVLLDGVPLSILADSDSGAVFDVPEGRHELTGAIPNPELLSETVERLSGMLSQARTERRRVAENPDVRATPEGPPAPLFLRTRTGGAVTDMISFASEGKTWIGVATERGVHLLTRDGREGRFFRTEAPIRVMAWWDAFQLLLVGCRDEQVIAFDLEGRRRWAFVSEMHRAVYRAGKTYWFKSAPGHEGIHGLRTGIFRNGKSQAFVGSACTLEILNGRGELEERLPVFWGPGTRFALIESPRGGTDLLIARQPTDSHALSVVNSRSMQVTRGRFAGVPAGHTYIGGWASMSRKHIFYEDLDADGTREVISEINGTWNRVTVWNANGAALYSANFGPGNRIPAQNMRDLDIGDLDGDGKKEILAATSTGLVVALDARCDRVWTRRLHSPPTVLAFVRASDASWVVTGCEDGSIVMLDGSGEVRGLGRVSGKPTRILRIGDGAVIGTDTGEVTGWKIGGRFLNDAPAEPGDYALHQSFPNPFNSECQIAYQLPGTGDVSLVVFNLLGQRIRVLVEGERQAGYYQVTWDGRDDAGREVSSGVYCSRLEVDGGKFTAVRKMVLLK